MILVTGASGLVGQHLISLLSKEGHRVRALYHHKKPALYVPVDSANVEWMASDLLDISLLEDAFENIHQVYHCAAKVSYDPRYFDEMIHTNVEGTANIVNLCLDQKQIKLCHVSSISTLGEAKANEGITESSERDVLAVQSTYATSKHDAEMEVWRGIAEGLNAIIVNPGIILGEGDDSKSSTHLFRIVADEFKYYTNGITAWVDVKDVVQIMVSLMQSTISAERFILSAGNYAYRDIFTMMAESMHKKPPYREASLQLTEWVWRFAYLKSLVTGKTASITKETARAAHQIRQFDTTKIHQALPEFRFSPIEESIARIGAFFQAKNNV
jgi:dihydroflavonol-4-reductase